LDLVFRVVLAQAVNSEIDRGEVQRIDGGGFLIVDPLLER
jgi:hypothetical protein